MQTGLTAECAGMTFHKLVWKRKKLASWQEEKGTWGKVAHLMSVPLAGGWTWPRVQVDDSPGGQ